ncbi:MAG: pantoate--beta-alanine ligase [Ilumatobacteraceae bacterium]|nr:pantoate--beta-alanine ligase [Ilumatobacteraceae bacterium]
MPTPIVFSTPDEQRSWADDVRRQGSTIGFVPTMGALHRGHIALIDHAHSLADVVVVSVFVNPRQFNQRADFDAYPRPIDDDVQQCAAAGVAAVFAPTGAAMYPQGFETTVTAGPLASTMEGAHRDGHFDGVVTVLTKLFSILRPDLAVFGEKDFQQLAIVRRLVTDLDLDVEIVGAPTVREPDGLALSSRNRRLDATARAAARAVPRALDAAIAAARDGSVDDALRAACDVFDAAPQVHPDYVEIFDPNTLRPVPTLEGRRVPGTTRIATAAHVGDVRLIDNRDLFERA